MTPKAATPKAVTPKAVTPEAGTPKAVTPEPVVPKAVPPKAPAEKSASSKAGPAKAKTAVPAKAGKAASGSKPAAAGGPAAKKTDPNVGRTVARCKLLECVGRGKTAKVYRAHHEAFHIDVAVKILTSEARNIPQLVERFQSEAKVVAMLDNENIVKIYDVGSEGDDHFIVMELLDGFSILDLIEREGQVEPMDALRIARQTANGLAAAHDKGIIHRDIKPQNLLLLEDGTVKVLDFGLAADFEGAGERVGTPHYMAPETCRDGSADLGTDVYALGIVLYHMLTGQPPYAGNSIKEILRKHMAGVPLRPEQKRQGGLDRKVGDLVRNMTKGDPLLRPTAQELTGLFDAIGGESLKQKDSLKKRRSSRARARTEAQKRSPLGPVLAGAVVVVGVLIAIMAGGDKQKAVKPGASDDSGRGVAQAPSGTGTQPDPVETAPDPTTPENPGPILSDAEKAAEAARLEKEKREKLKKGKLALARAEGWARENWHTNSDTDAVIDKYISVYQRFKGTEPGDEARRRYRAIKKKELHPHPDRSWSDAASIAEVRQQWTERRPKIEAALANHRYASALNLLPERVNDADGELSAELRLWADIIEQLRKFQSGVVRGVPALDKEQRMIQLESGPAEVRIITISDMQVRTGTKTQTLKWAEVPALQIVRLATHALKPQGAPGVVQRFVFAFVHRLEDEFWNLQLELGGTGAAKQFAKLTSELESRVDARMKDG